MQDNAKIKGTGLAAAFALLLMLQMAGQLSAAAGSPATGQACSAAGSIITVTEGNFSLDWSNWRILVAVGLMISAALVGMLYMFASVMKDEGLMARARTEISQIILTAVLSVFFIVFVEFLCSSSVPPALLGLPQGNLFDNAENYLNDISSYTRSGFQTVFFFTSFLTFYDSYSEKSAGQNALTWGFAGGLKNLAPKAFMTMFLFAYLSASLHIYLLRFILIYSLMFLIPAGIILRSIFPFRRYGGALLGAGITLCVFFPFLLLLDSVMMGAYFQNPDFLNIECTNNLECLSKICGSASAVNPSMHGNMCYPVLSAGEKCDDEIGDWQCGSGRCVKKEIVAAGGSSTDKVCANVDQLRVEPEDCLTDSDCTIQLWCKIPESGHRGKCTKSLDTDAACTRHGQCGMPGMAFCDPITRSCKKALPTVASCNDNIECASLYCDRPADSNEKQCLEVKADYRQLAVDIGKTTPSSGNLLAKISPITALNKITQPVIIALFGGVILPLINFMLLSRTMKDLSGFFGAEMDIASIYRIL
jgi:hypothetical protein